LFLKMGYNFHRDLEKNFFSNIAVVVANSFRATGKRM